MEMILKRYKIFIFVLVVGVFLTSMISGYYYFERTTILDHYENISNGLIGMANEHLKRDKLEWNFTTPVSEGYIQELNSLYSFAKKSYHLNDILLINPDGQVVYTNNSNYINQKILSSDQLAELSKQESVVFFPQMDLLGHQQNFDVDTYHPIYVNGKISGYILLKYDGTPQTNLFLKYNQWFFPTMILLLILLLFSLYVYLKRYLRAEEKIQNTQKMLEQLFDNASDGIVVLDENKKVQMMNKVMEKMIGRTFNKDEAPLTCKDFLCCTLSENDTGEKLCPLTLKRNADTPFFDFEMLNAKNEILNVSASVSSLKNEVTGEALTIMLIRDETNKNKEALQLEVLEEFDRVLSSPVEMDNMVTFITERMKTLTNCDHVLIFEGESYETGTIRCREELWWEERARLLPEEQKWVVQTYLTKKIQEVRTEKGPSFITVPLVVNRQMVGVLLLLYRQSFLLEKKRKMLLQKISTSMAALMKVYNLILATNEQRELNERMYKLGIALQTIKSEQDVPAKILAKIKTMIGVDFIAYRSRHNQYSAWNAAIGNLNPVETYDPSKDILEHTLKWGSSFFIENYPTKVMLEVEDVSLLHQERLKTVYTFPLIYNNKIFGAILFGSRNLKILTEEKQQLIRTLINMIAVQVENKNLYAQIENDATILERQRISREIHDGLAQNIGFITIQLHRLKKLMEKNQNSKAIQEIEVIKEAVDESYVELRETIDQLRDLTGYKENLGIWLKKYSEEFEQTHRIKVSFDMMGMDKIRLNENQRVQITRVIQEVLNNIRKHSKASEVKVYASGGKNLSLVIEDNGIGFDILALKKTKYSGHGLPILEERIHSINGDILIDSKPNQGTKVEIHVPMVG
jgi:signal transduction histidine kinase/PAS domain-containing protein